MSPKTKAKKIDKKPAEKKDERSLTEKMRDHLRQAAGYDGAADTLANGGYSQVKEIMPTRIDVLDHWVLGIGGLPYGRIIEISGPEDTCKSSFAAHLMWAAQQDGAIASLGDGERKVQPSWLDNFKVSRKDVLLLPANTVEEYLKQVTATIKKYKRTKIMFLLDSVATTQPQAALDEDLTESQVPGAMAAAWSRGLRELNHVISDSRSMLILINQIRMKIGVMFGNPETTPGGQATKYYPSIRLTMGHGKHYKDGTQTIGQWVPFRPLKNHLVSERRKAQALMMYADGFDNDRSTLMFARENGNVDSKCRSAREAREALHWPQADGPDVAIEEPEPKPAV